jgi:hypothetical protein
MLVNFIINLSQTRNIPAKIAKAPKPAPSHTPQECGADDSDATEDDDDLDAVPKSQSQSSKLAVRKPPSHTKPHAPEPSPLPKTASPTAKSKPRGFKIGGKPKTPAFESPPPEGKPQATQDIDMKEPPSSQLDVETDATPKKGRRTFKIGGKGRGANGSASQRDLTDSPNTKRTRDAQSPTAEPPSSPPAPTEPVKKETPEPEHQETPEEKAERRRSELKRKTDEAARKQALTKKKRRF